MADRAIEFELADSFGNSIGFTDTSGVREFLDSERENWSWLSEASHSGTPNMDQVFQNAFRAIEDWIRSFEDGPLAEADFRAKFLGQYQGDKPQLLFSEFHPGVAVAMIREQFGVDDAERALAFTTGKTDPQLTVFRDFRLWQLVAVPSQIADEVWTSEHQRQIARIRGRMSGEITKYSNQFGLLRKDWEAANRADRARYRRIAGKALRWGSARVGRITDRAEQSLQALDATRAAYEVQMQLKAPVGYWSDKAISHGKSAKAWGIALAVYVIVAAILAGLLFVPAWRAMAGGDALTGRHFLMVAAIGAGLTLLFWIARLGVRIYLGERHLYTDAEERRVMTQAYLALIKEQAATDEERIVILSALFRTASDGIVKDDGGGDISLPAMVARLLDARK